MRVIKVEPGKRLKIIDVPNELEALQKEVDGYIECVSFDEDAVIICNEEGAINGMEFNVYFNGHMLFGPLLVAGVDGEEFCDIPEEAEVAFIAGWALTKQYADQIRWEARK